MIAVAFGDYQIALYDVAGEVFATDNRARTHRRFSPTARCRARSSSARCTAGAFRCAPARAWVRPFRAISKPTRCA
jgi:hypothetical protein